MDFDVLLKDKYHISLNPQQREAVFTTDGPMLLLAVPGSGKTTVIVARCAYMVLCRGIAPESILTLTFNRSAQRDMESRYGRVFGQDTQGSLRFSTIHSFCNSVLREFGAAVGRKVPRLIEEGKPRLLRNLYAGFNDGEYLPDDRLEELANTIGYVKNMMLTAEQIREGKYDIKNFSRVFTAYEDYKNENGFMDFDDMLDKALAVFKVKPDILARFRAQYRYINVDEAQDTSKLQHAIIQKLAAPLNNLFMVGDEDQSIYRFRAASPEYLLDFKKVYPDARILLMERNYRSTHAIVDAARRLIARNTARHMKGMETGNEIGMPIEETCLSDNSLLCDHLATRLQSAQRTGTLAVLYRENTSAVAVMDALDRQGIPFYIREHRLNFFDHWVVRDVLAFLRLAHDPADMQALRQIYYKLNAFISRELFDQAAALMGQGSGTSALGAVLACPGLKEAGAARLQALARGIAELPGLSPGAAISHILEKLGYGQYLKKTGGEGYYMESLLHIVENLKLIASRTATYAELLDRISQLPALVERANKNYGAGVATLSSVHSAKGLEFDSVIVIDLFEGRFPTAAAISKLEAGEKDLMEEERRLFYVAVTRARKHVELVHASKIHGEKVKPSRFIRELLPRIPVHRIATHMNKKAAGLLSPAKPIPPMAAGAEEPAIEIGMEISHRSFGNGVVTAYDAEHDIVAVKFPKYGVKTLAAGFCVKGGMMIEVNKEVSFI